MKIYLVASSEEGLNILLDESYPHILVSQLHKHLVKKAIVGIARKNIDLMIDSGAYTAWTKGQKIDIDNYIAFCKEVNKINHGNSIWFVNLDVIPGRFGFVPSKEDIEKSAQEGWRNYEKMREAGLKVIHIFHQHEDWKWLEKLLDTDDDYIGISPANDLPSKKRLMWLMKVFHIVKNKKRTHGFGVTDIKILKKIPFYSADSSNWTALSRWGCAYMYSRLKSRSVFYKRLKDALSMKLNPKALRDTRFLRRNEVRKIVKNYLLMERELTKLWEIRGIEFV